MANEENLKPFKKGQSGNPKGKAKGTKNRKTIINEILASKDPTGEYGTMQEAMIAAVAKKAAIEGDHKALAAIFDRVDGRPHQTQSIEHDVKPDSDILKEVRQLADKKREEQKKGKK